MFLCIRQKAIFMQVGTYVFEMYLQVSGYSVQRLFFKPLYSTASNFGHYEEVCMYRARLQSIVASRDLLIRWINPDFFQDSFPMRLREIHIINTPFFFDALFACFSPFLKEKFRKRVSLPISYTFLNIHPFCAFQVGTYFR